MRTGGARLKVPPNKAKRSPCIGKTGCSKTRRPSAASVCVFGRVRPSAQRHADGWRRRCKARTRPGPMLTAKSALGKLGPRSTLVQERTMRPPGRRRQVARHRPIPVHNARRSGCPPLRLSVVRDTRSSGRRHFKTPTIRDARSSGHRLPKITAIQDAGNSGRPQLRSPAVQILAALGSDFQEDDFQDGGFQERDLKPLAAARSGSTRMNSPSASVSNLPSWRQLPRRYTLRPSTRSIPALNCKEV